MVSPPGTAAVEDAPHLLVVDDDPAISKVIQYTLEDEGFAVVTAADGQEAVDLATQREPALLILDMALPRLNGDGVADALHRLYDGRVPILLITADGRAAQKAQRTRAFDYLAKPFDVNRLVTIVRRQLHMD